MFTYNDYFKFGYDGEWFNSSKNGLVFNTSYAACERPAKNFKEECFATAKLIRDTNETEKLNVLFSGGLKSELIVRSFVEQQIPISVFICQFKDNLNIHDISYAIIYCEHLGVRYKIIDIDIIDFFENQKYLKYQNFAKMTKPLMAISLWLSDQVDGIPIFGMGGYNLVKRLPSDYIDGISLYQKSQWDLIDEEDIAIWYQQFNERKAIPSFCRHTPEIMLSFLKDPRITDLVNDKVIGKRTIWTSEYMIYNKYFPMMDRKRYTGFEKLIPLTSNILRDKPIGKSSMIEYNHLIKTLEGGY